MELDGAVLDAPVVETEIEEQIDPAAEVVDPAEQVEKVEEVKGDERLISQKWRDLKATNPELYKEYKGLFFGQKTLGEKLKDFDLDGTKAFLEEHGGRESLATVLTDLKGQSEELQGITQAVQQGSPELIDRMAELSPDAFPRLADAANQKWRQVDPEGWSRQMSGVMAATISQSGIPAFLDKMAMMLQYNDTANFGNALKELQTWAGSFGQAATAPPPVARSLGGKPQDVNSERQTWEQEKFDTTLKDEVDNFRNPEIAKELDSFFKRRPNDADAKELAISTTRAQVIDRMSKDLEFQRALNALTARKDREGAMRLIRSREATAIKDIAPKVGRTIFGNPGAVVATEKKTGAAAVKPEAGFSVVDKPPRPELIDRMKTTDAMIMRGQFILKDGRKQSLEA